MKRLFTLFLISSTIFIFSCGDDNKPDDSDLCGRELPFGKRLSNQTKNVLLPLEVGREWHYKVTRNGVISYDTIKVLSKEKCADGDWYKLKSFLMIGDEGYYINTSTGLWTRCPNCSDSVQYTFVDYPSIKKPFSTQLIMAISVPIKDDNGNVIGENLLTLPWITESTAFKDLEVNGKTYSGIKCTLSHKSCSGRDIPSPYYEFYFTPGVGCVKALYSGGKQGIYELIP